MAGGILASLAGVFGVGLVLGLLVEPGQVDRLSRFQARLLQSRVGQLARPARAAPISWPSYGADLSSTRYSPAGQVDRTNVQSLQVAWIHPTDERTDRQRTTPIVLDGVLYYTAGATTAIAVDAASGRERWRHRHTPVQQPRSCCLMSSRGVAADTGQVYMATIDARLIALDRATGARRWERAVANPDSGYALTMAPLVVGDLVVVGVSGGEFGIRGFVDAYDARTGERRWRFWTIPSPDEGGWWGGWVTTTPDGDRLDRDIARERTDSARYAESWRTGGGGAWMTPSYDSTLRTLYIGIGNPAPMYNGRTRPGDNLYTAAIVALDVDRGTRKWHYQISPHDEADRDMAAPIVLFDWRRGDSTVPALAQANKTGWVYVLDRRTGRRLLRSEALIPQHNMFVRPAGEGKLMYPGPDGGHQSGAPAYSPRTGLLYALMRHAPAVVQSREDTFRLGYPYEGGRKVGQEGRPGGKDPWNTMAAVDLRSGKVRWQRRELVPVAHAAGGVLATAGDLVFYAVHDELRALDAETGRTLWRFRCDGRLYAPAISYAVGGRQFIAVASRTTLFAFALPSR
ncbi:MAG TPA: PQQ-binding-like beta-propeller repeat protein [Gemmatimonadales bacterium]|nr:PQQ-binding-like beta-propeller repeat protein [Gemmatimonadales bacterium]